MKSDYVHGTSFTRFKKVAKTGFNYIVIKMKRVSNVKICHKGLTKLLVLLKKKDMQKRKTN